MASYPSSIYSPRTKANKSGVVYTPAKTTVIYAEDVVYDDNEIVAIETELGTLAKWGSANIKERLKGIRSLSSANEDTLVVKESNVGIGTAGPGQILHVAANITPIIQIDSANAAGGFVMRTSNGTLTSPTATALDDTLFGIAGAGYQTTTGAYTGNKALIGGRAAESYTSTAQGSYLVFETTAIGGTTRTEKMRIDSAGNVGIGTTAPSTKLDVIGNASVSLTFEAGNIISNGTLSAAGLSTLGAITATGVVDFGGATSFEVPNGAGGTIVDAAGEVTVDTTSDSFHFYGSADKVIKAKKCFAYIYEAPTAKDEWGRKLFDDPFTITQVWATASGSNAVGWNMNHGPRGAITTALFSGNHSASSAVDGYYTSFADATLSDGEYLQLVITSASATIEEFDINLCGFYDP